MPDDAVSRFAEPRQMHEQSLFEESGQRIVQVT